MATTTNYGWTTPDDSDLVKDGAAAIRSLGAAIDGTFLGLGKNVIQTAKLDTFSTSSATFTPVTGLTASITPSSATSKVLVSAVISFSSSANTGQAQFNLMRGATAIAQPSGGTNPATAHVVVGNANSNQTVKIMFLDSPASASSVTYSVDVKALGGTTAYVNQTGVSADDTTISSITLIEVYA